MHTLKFTQFLPLDINTAWKFFSSPYNLEKITPEFMDFKITSEHMEQNVYAGMIITYKVKPVLGIPIEWVTEITHVEAPNYFVDEQRYGPYAFWHHKHFIKEVKGGVEMIDLLHYKMPFWFIGKIVNSLFVKKQLKKVFDYRYNKLEEMFGGK